jgi:hypothetical protein
MCDVAPAQPQENNGHTDDAPSAEEESPTINIVINNVVSSFSVCCHLNLRKIASEGVNVEFRKENGVGMA